MSLTPLHEHHPTQPDDCVGLQVLTLSPRCEPLPLLHAVRRRLHAVLLLPHGVLLLLHAVLLLLRAVQRLPPAIARRSRSGAKPAWQHLRRWFPHPPQTSCQTPCLHRRLFLDFSHLASQAWPPLVILGLRPPHYLDPSPGQIWGVQIQRHRHAPLPRHGFAMPQPGLLLPSTHAIRPSQHVDLILKLSFPHPWHDPSTRPALH
mmetsp:Transcript_47771/g.138070  ORF Transcript_47771/g.138070 Transcript_47771/m.138070 type:complete len:204 (+) Transcript_47771:1418-2029(+)